MPLCVLLTKDPAALKMLRDGKFTMRSQFIDSCDPLARTSFNFSLVLLRKILVSVKFLSAILGPEMGASILWTPGKMRSFCRKNLHVHKIPRFTGGYFGVFLGGGGSADFIFMGADFSDLRGGVVKTLRGSNSLSRSVFF